MNQDTGGKILAAIVLTSFAILISIAMGAYQVFAEGYCASVLWGWFAVPLGLRVLGWSTFAGASCLYSLVRLRLPIAKPKDERSASDKLSEAFAYIAMPWVILAIGWCVK